MTGHRETRTDTRTFDCSAATQLKGEGELAFHFFSSSSLDLSSSQLFVHSHSWTIKPGDTQRLAWLKDAMMDDRSGKRRMLDERQLPGFDGLPTAPPPRPAGDPSGELGPLLHPGNFSLIPSLSQPLPLAHSHLPRYTTRTPTLRSKAPVNGRPPRSRRSSSLSLSSPASSSPLSSSTANVDAFYAKREYERINSGRLEVEEVINPVVERVWRGRSRRIRSSLTSRRGNRRCRLVLALVDR